jgi:hypothetical protein
MGVGGAAGAGGSAGSPIDSGFPDVVGFPEVGTTQCDAQGTCVLCNDGMWHCYGDVFAPCPTGAQFGGSCSPYGAMCLTCAPDGGGNVLECMGAIATASWYEQSISCLP